MQKRLFLTLALLLSLCNLHAKAKTHETQPPPVKIGYTTVEYILGLLPEAKVNFSEYESFRKQLEKQFENRIEEFHQKEQALQQGSETMNEAEKNKKIIVLQQLQESIKRLQLEYQEKLNTKYGNLFKPLHEKIQNTIAQVAKENGYTHVLNAGVESMLVLLYADEEHDISGLVLKKLGIDPDKAKDKK